MPRVKELTLDVNNVSQTAILDFVGEVIHVFNYSPYNVYVSRGSNIPNNTSAFMVVAPQSIGIIPLNTDSAGFFLDVIGIPSASYPVSIKIWDSLVPVEQQSLPNPIGSGSVNIVILEGDKSGDITTTSTNFVNIGSNGLLINQVIPTGNCLLNFHAILSGSNAGSIARFRFLIDGVVLAISGTTDGEAQIDISNGTQTIDFNIPVTGLNTLNTLAFTIQWRISAGTLTLQNDATNGAYIRSIITV